MIKSLEVFFKAFHFGQILFILAPTRVARKKALFLHF